MTKCKSCKEKDKLIRQLKKEIYKLQSILIEKGIIELE
jgi:hypothetical protein